MTFWANATTFKYALGLRPRARRDDLKAQQLAKKNWPVLKKIAREALDAGQIVHRDASKSWQIHYTIDDAFFSELIEKYEGEIVR